MSRLKMRNTSIKHYKHHEFRYILLFLILMNVFIILICYFIQNFDKFNVDE
jgi:hypothetical protein